MSQMYLVQPIKLTAASLVSTTALDATPNWAAGTYAKDDAVLYTAADGLPHKWISLVAANTATPGTDPAKWLDAGAGNKYAMFDAYNSSQTQAASTLVVDVLPGSAFTTLALFNLAGASVQVQAINTASEVIFDETKSLARRGTTGWSQYYFAGFEARLTQAVFEDLPFSTTSKIRITITGPSTVGIGRMVVGRKTILGILEHGAAPFLIDYSRKEWDADFGDYTWVTRDYSRGFRGTVWVENTQLNNIWTTLIAVRAVPTLWVGSAADMYSETLVTLGVMQDAPVSINYSTNSVLNFTIEGLT
jgi:hypothetical protein